MAKRTKVRVRWTDRAGGRYAAMRWTKDGKRSEKGLGYVTEAEAEEARLDQEAALRLGLQLEIASVEPSVVADVLIAYVEDMRARHGGKKYGHAELNRSEILADAVGHMRPDRVSTATLRRYAQQRVQQLGKRSGKPIKRSTVFAEMATLKRAFRFAKDTGLIECDPPSLPSKKDLPDDSRPARRLDEDEVRSLIQAAHQDVRQGFGTLIQMLAWSGRRPVAVFDLRPKDLKKLDQRKAYYERDKGGEARGWGPLTTPAHAALAQRLDELGEGDDERWLWPRDCGDPYSTESIRQPWYRTRARAGLPGVNVYDLRKFAATRIYRVTGCVRTTMQFTGHTNPQTLLKYYIYADVDAAEVAAPKIGWTPAPLRVVEEDG